MRRKRGIKKDLKEKDWRKRRLSRNGLKRRKEIWKNVKGKKRRRKCV